MALTALLLATTVMSQDTYALLWKPKQNELSIYELFLSIEDSSGEASVEASLEYKVSKVNEDGSYQIESKSLGAIVKLQGQEIKDDRPNESSAKFGHSGQLLEITSSKNDLEKHRNALLSRFVSPPASVKVGDKWSYERKANSPKGMGAIKINYQLVTVFNGEANVSFTFTESGVPSPMKATGNWWVSTTTGKPVRLTAKADNYLSKANTKATIRLISRSTARTAKERS